MMVTLLSVVIPAPPFPPSPGFPVAESDPLPPLPPVTLPPFTVGVMSPSIPAPPSPPLLVPPPRPPSCLPPFPRRQAADFAALSTTAPFRHLSVPWIDSPASPARANRVGLRLIGEPFRRAPAYRSVSGMSFRKLPFPACRVLNMHTRETGAVRPSPPASPIHPNRANRCAASAAMRAITPRRALRRKARKANGSWSCTNGCSSARRNTGSHTAPVA